MSNLVIVEGPDCSGKTTLSKFLANKWGGAYLHHSGDPKLHPVMPEYHLANLDSIEWTLKNVGSSCIILDRHWPSEHIYGCEFRPDLVDRYPFKEVQDRIRALGGIYIFCMDDHVESRHEANHVAENHVTYDRGQFHNIVQAYNVMQAFMYTRGDTMLYNMLVDGPHLNEVSRRASDLLLNLPELPHGHR